MTTQRLNQADYLNQANNQAKRLLFLDGLRGIAILLVLFFHAYSNDWIDNLPYRDQYDHITLFHFGRYGVQLFFIISGFVIAMTLEKCKSFWDFMYRRWLRLFPAMLVGSLIVLATAPLFPARPFGVPHLQDLLPGLTLIEPEFYRLFLQSQGILEGSFWTLFVEMKFYILAGILYFTIGPKKMIAVLLAMFFSSIVLEFASPHLSTALSDQLQTLYHYLNWSHYGCFAAGALFYQYYVNKDMRYWYAALVVALIAARCLGGLPTKSMIYASIIVFAFAFSMFNPTVQKMLSNKFLVFVGFISYPLYLVHENATVSMINQIHDAYPTVPGYLLPIVPTIIVTIVAWIIAKYLEPMTRKLIKQALSFKTVNLSRKLD
jgi:peptidoglycan/LPS O-acetylase OafA/YrhL